MKKKKKENEEEKEKKNDEDEEESESKIKSDEDNKIKEDRFDYNILGGENEGINEKYRQKLDELLEKITI